MAYFKILTRHPSTVLEDNHEILNLGNMQPDRIVQGFRCGV
jgi:hypothetical protein